MVFLATPVTRTVARMVMPSTRQAMTCALRSCSTCSYWQLLRGCISPSGGRLPARAPLRGAFGQLGPLLRSVRGE